LPKPVRISDLVFVCVGTPSLSNGGIDLKYTAGCGADRPHARQPPGAPVIVMRSTMLPGTMAKSSSLFWKAFRIRGLEGSACASPEFLREGTARARLLPPPKTVIGEVSRASGDLLRRLYARTRAR